MDKHYLTPLFAPETIVVFAGRQEDEASLTPHARAVHEALRAQRYTGRLVFLDIHTTGTLAALAQTRADLAVIALPPDDVASALEVAGRMACRAVLVISSGIGPELAADLKKIAQREGVHLLGHPAPGAAAQCECRRSAGPTGLAGTGLAVGGAHGVHSGLGTQQCRGFFLRGVARAQYSGGHCAGAGFPRQRPDRK